MLKKKPAQKTWQGDFADYLTAQLPQHAGKTYKHPISKKVLEDPFDLKNLKFFRIEDSLKLLDELKSIVTKLKTEQKVVAFIGTGGTIAMVRQGDELVPKIDSKTLLGELPASRRSRFRAAAMQLPEMVDSSIMHPDVIADVALLMSGLWHKMPKNLRTAFAGFIVTHGTDTMAESAAMCRMMLGRNVPFSVCFVGAQKTVESTINDVSANLVGALSSLELTHDSGIPQQFVYMNGSSGSAMNPVGVVKMSDSNIEAFHSPMHQATIKSSDFAMMGVQPLRTNDESLKRRFGIGSSFYPVIVRKDVAVEQFRASPGRNPDLDFQIASSFDIHTDAIVVVTYGGFTYHPRNFEAIMRGADTQGLPVFVTNPFPSGSTDHDYGPARFIRDNTTAVPVEILPSALVAKIHVGSAIYGDKSKKTKDFILNTDYVGEQPPGWKPARQ